VHPKAWNAKGVSACGKTQGVYQNHRRPTGAKKSNHGEKRARNVLPVARQKKRSQVVEEKRGENPIKGGKGGLTGPREREGGGDGPPVRLPSPEGTSPGAQVEARGRGKTLEVKSEKKIDKEGRGKATQAVNLGGPALLSPSKSGLGRLGAGP